VIPAQQIDASVPSVKRPRVGFLGVGWIGRDRMRAIAVDDRVEVAMIADVSADLAAATAIEVGAEAVDPGEIFESELDGLVIATPSAMHAHQAIAALDAGMAVFCQKPLGRDEAECRAVVDAARRADRLLGVDMSYRHLAATRAMHGVISSGAIGEIFAVDLVFHNGYGPDKAWFKDSRLSGGGCVIDLGIHLVDLAGWMLGGIDVQSVHAQLYSAGQPFAAGGTDVEDYAVAQLRLSSGTTISLACSWFLAVGCDAVIRATFHGTAGSIELSNVNGSFYDFTARRFCGTAAETLAEPPDSWGGRAACEWAARLAAGCRFDEGAEELIATARTIDRIYGR
jgi:predicted dehydrogenase